VDGLFPRSCLALASRRRHRYYFVCWILEMPWCTCSTACFRVATCKFQSARLFIERAHGERKGRNQTIKLGASTYHVLEIDLGHQC
jgi:hypothetical protein